MASEPSALTDDEIDAEIVRLGVEALRQAHQRALALGRRVLVRQVFPDGTAALIELRPDGTRHRIQDLAPPTPIAVGTKMRLR
jgi:hypothetical protein